MRKLVAILGFLGLSAVARTAPADDLGLGPITAGGAASDDFALGPSVFAPGVDIAGIIERDRMYMAARPGFLVKQLPFSFDEHGAPYSGGRYLFDSYDDALDFSDWVANDFVLDGVPILERDYFIGVTAYAYEMIGGWRWQHVNQQVAMRVERFSTAGSHLGPHAIRALLHLQLLRIVHEAHQRGYSEVWLAYSAPDDLVAITYFVHRANPTWDHTAPDFATLGALAGADSLAPPGMRALWPKVFDRTSWIFNTWFPFSPGDSGQPSNWPNSPPFPQPHSSDGVCEPSRGENHTNSPGDCLATCGNAVPNAGENTQNCPGDVPL